MMTFSKGIKCIFVISVCFHHVLSEKKSCSELQGHRNWPELHRASSVCGFTGASVAPRVMGGRPAALAEFPWMALLTYSPCGVRCGGFLITGHHVLTAGHCCDVSWLANGCNVSGVILGEHGLDTSVDCYRGRCAPEPIHIPVNKVTIHENYHLETISNDICLLTLDRNIQPSTYVNPICLPDECTWKEPDYKRDQLKIAGWGNDEDKPGRLHTLLQTLNMIAVPQPICSPLWEAYYGLQVNESRQLCAGMELGRDKCKGDSGGPLMYQLLDRMVAVGIVSYGQNCSRNDTFQRPAVYTRIAHYMPWILDNM